MIQFTGNTGTQFNTNVSMNECISIHLTPISLSYSHSRSLFQVQGHSLITTFLWSLPSHSESEFLIKRVTPLRYNNHHCDHSK